MSIVSSITGIWTDVSSWFIQTMELVPGIFYDSETGLTFIGTLAVFGAGIGIILGIIRMIRGWVKAR